MNYDGPWSWRSTKQAKPVQSDEERAYVERVTERKRRRLSDASKRRRRAERKAIKAANDAPIF